MATTNEAPQVSYRELADAKMEQLKAIRDTIPHLVFPTTESSTQRLSRAASLPPAFIEFTAVVLKNSPPLARGGKADPDRVRGLMSYATAFGPFADELEALALFVRHSVTAARNEAGTEALLTYALAKRLSKRPENAELLPLVEDMRRELGIRNRKKTAVEEEETETAAP
jgi:hypothetical protein